MNLNNKLSEEQKYYYSRANLLSNFLFAKIKTAQRKFFVPYIMSTVNQFAFGKAKSNISKRLKFTVYHLLRYFVRHSV